MVNRWSEKGTGLKILWLTTIGTAAILMMNVMRTKIQNMEKLLNEEDGIQSEPAGYASSAEEILKEE